jgi:beta-glucosidase
MNHHTTTATVPLSTPLLTADDVAELLSVLRSSVYEYARRRIDPLPSLLIGRHRRFDRRAVEAWLGAQAVRAAAPGARVGIVHLLTDCEPGGDREEDAAAARREDGHHNRWWLDPVFGRGLPADMIEEYGVEPPVRAGDLEAIAAPLDWLGVNYYRRSVTVADPAGPPPRTRQITPAGTPRTGLDWEIHPDRLAKILVRVAREYGPRSIMVTENGSAYADTVTPDGRVHDAERTAYLEAHLAACASAIRAGVPLDGYFAWSLLDNFEWAYGYAQRFGLVHVDFATQERRVKDSGRRYAEIIRAHRDLAAGAVAAGG